MSRVILIFLFFGISACGVKGDPLPPEQPPRLGRGHPTYQRAGEDITPAPPSALEKESEENEDDEEDTE